MAEQLDLTTPTTPPTLTFWRVTQLVLNRGDIPAAAEVVIVLRGTNNEALVHRYDGQEAFDQIIALNTANLSNNSLERRVLSRLVADGVISGTISGSPD